MTRRRYPPNLKRPKTGQVDWRKMAETAGNKQATPLWETPELAQRAAKAGIIHPVRVNKNRSFNEQDLQFMIELVARVKQIKAKQ